MLWEQQWRNRLYAARMTASICRSQLVNRFQLAMFWPTIRLVSQGNQSSHVECPERESNITFDDHLTG
jgi:hypothetical protein